MNSSQGTPTSAPQARAEATSDPAGDEEARLPLRELDRALAPVRRSVRSALDRRTRPRYLSALLRPHVERALGLGLPGALQASLQELDSLVAGLPPAESEELPGRLAEVSARVSRIDALAGLPLPVHLRPVQKLRQQDRPEEEAPPAPIAPSRPAEAAAAPAPAAPAAPADADEDEEDDGPVEFAGDLLQPLLEVIPTELASAGADRLAALGFETVRDLLWCRPSRVERLAPIHGAGRELPAAGRVVLGGRVTARFTVFRPDGSREAGALLVGAGATRVRWASGWLRPPSPAGRNHPKAVVVGTVHAHDNGLIEVIDAEPVDAEGNGAHVPSWDLPGVPDLLLRQVLRALASGFAQVRDPLPPESVRRHGLLPLAEAIEAAQARATEAGRRRFAFDEALLVQLGAVIQRAGREGAASGSDRGIGHPILHSLVGRLGQTADLVLDDAAQVILEDIKRDLRRNVPSRRVVTSEVGGGKGRIALLAAVLAAESKNQVLMVGADATDAEQRFLLAEPLLKEAGLSGRLLTGSATPGQREAIRRGEIHVVFAGPEIFEDGFLASAGPEAERSRALAFRRLGLLVAFERDTFGHASVAHARMTGPRPHLLVFTTIPVGVRVLTTAYADHAVSVRVDPERRPARIALCGAEERLQAYVRIREVVDAGGQGVVVFPTADGADALDIPDALRLVRALEGDTLKGVRVALLHGAMPAAERARVIDDALHRRVQVLVSTARVEDVPSIPGASIVVVEQADRMEQWRLHRVIGFFSRAERPANAILVVGENAEPESAARIDRVVSAPDGFSLTEALVRMRGVERSVAAGSAPAPSWRWVDPDQDLALVLAAREEAHRLLRADATLRRGGPSELSAWLRRRWAELWPDHEALGWACPIREDLSAEPRKKRRRRRRKR